MKRVALDFGVGHEYPVLDGYMRSRALVSVIIGPLGSGKTFGSIQRLLKQACEQNPNEHGVRPSRWMAIRNTYPDLTGTTIKDFKAVVRDLGTMKMDHPPTWRAQLALPDSSVVDLEVIFQAMDREDAVRSIRGSQLTGVWCNEMRELEKAVVDMAQGRTSRYPSGLDGGVLPSWYGVMGDTNAFDTEHWLYRLYETGTDGWEFFVQPGGVIRDQSGQWVVNAGAENRHNLVEGYYRNQIAGKREDWIRVNLANEFIFHIEGQPVHPEYVDRVHTFSGDFHVEPGSHLYLGADFGRTPAVAVIHHDAASGRYRVLGEQTTDDGESAVLFAPRVKRWLDMRWPGCRWKGWGDPAGDAKGQATESTPLEILRANGIPFEAAPTNNPLLRRAAITNPLTRLCMDGRPALLVHEDAKMIRRGLMGGFHYRRVQVPGTERFMDVPEKNRWSHPCFVAGTMISTPGGRVPIETLRPGDEVSTPLGPRRVTAASPRMANVVDLDTGVSVTPDHPFLSSHGWVRADALASALLVTEGCPTWIQRWLLRYAQRPSTRSSSSSAFATTCDRLGTTRATTGTAIATCTGWSGRRRTVRSRMASICITAMETVRTIAWRIWNYWPAMLTSPGTCWSPSAGPRLQPTCGTRFGRQLTGAGGTRSALERFAWLGPQGRSVREGSASAWSASASGAERRFSPIRLLRLGLGSARKIASHPLVGLLAWMMSSASVRNALVAFGRIATRGSSTARVAVLGNARQERVYTLSVAEARCYYAEGVLVSNCEALEYGLLGLGEGHLSLMPASLPKRRRETRLPETAERM